MSATSIHDWLRPLLANLVQEGVGRGFDPQAVVATMIDLVETENFGVAQPTPAAPPPPPPPPRD